MVQKVKMFSEENQYKLQEKINDFAQNHHIEMISYSTCQVGYLRWHYVCILYTERK